MGVWRVRSRHAFLEQDFGLKQGLGRGCVRFSSRIFHHFTWFRVDSRGFLVFMSSFAGNLAISSVEQQWL
jgi:hypothetical protein